MTEVLDFLTRHGPMVLFLAVFVEQAGVPLPASPWMLAAGALSVSGSPHWAVALAAAAGGSLLADSIWFYLGRRGGPRVLKLLCRISLEPDSCVRRTQDLFGRYGLRSLVVAKFIPGLAMLAPPLAGNSGVSFWRFMVFDGFSAVLYTGSFIAVGAIFNKQLDQVLAALENLGGGAVALVAGLLALYIGYKFFQRQKLLKELRMARITVDELYKKLEAGETPLIFDLRSESELQHDPLVIRGARHVTIEELKQRQHEIPPDRDIILYCDCPNEVSSARMAQLLHNSGFARARPLLGGIDAWRERNYPTETRVTVAKVEVTSTTIQKTQTTTTNRQ
jgi:membrane protein DedA with SNARE-associated domain/rhodanese-related sulfurtransferase